jgi:hypothetical protein
MIFGGCRTSHFAYGRGLSVDVLPHAIKVHFLVCELSRLRDGDGNMLFVHSSCSSSGREKATRRQPSGMEALTMLVRRSYAEGDKGEEKTRDGVRYIVGSRREQRRPAQSCHHDQTRSCQDRANFCLSLSAPVQVAVASSIRAVEA